MEISPAFRAWLLRKDPRRPDFDGHEQRARERIVARLEKTELDALCTGCQQKRKEITARLLGGPGSGHFGHAGRPGEVGGSASGEEASRERISRTYDLQHLLVYHGTASKVIEQIRKEGIKPRGSSGADEWALMQGWGRFEDFAGLTEAQIADREASVFVSTDPTEAASFSQLATEMHPGSTPVLIQADVPEENIVEDEASNALRFRGVIKPEWIKVIEPAKGGKKFYHPEGITFLAAATRRFYFVVLADQDTPRTLGGPGSGHFGHAGRPGEVGGSAPSAEGEGTSPIEVSGAPKDVRQAETVLASLPEPVKAQSVMRHLRVVPGSEVDDHISTFFLREFGMDRETFERLSQGQPLKSLVDRETGEVISTPDVKTVLDSFSRTLVRPITKAMEGGFSQETFTDLFTSKYAQELMGLSSPLAVVLEPLLKKWGLG